jgi:hypothetical protein
MMKMNNKLIFGVVLALTTAQLALAVPTPTAFDLAKQGNQYVGVQSKDKVLRIYSEKSTTGLAPTDWHVVYFDPDTFVKSADVEFANGQQVGVSHMRRPFQMPANARDILDMSKITVNSDNALSIAQSQPVLKGITAKYSKMSLEAGDSGPTWQVELWAAKTSNPSKDVSIGKVWILATDGSVIKSDLRPDKVN